MNDSKQFCPDYDFDRVMAELSASDAPTPEIEPPNDFSPAAMAPGELFGDRIIACGIWLDCAIASLTQCPDYPKDDVKIDMIVAKLGDLKRALNQQLDRFPAASITQGTKL